MNGGRALAWILKLPVIFEVVTHPIWSKNELKLYEIVQNCNFQPAKIGCDLTDMMGLS